MEGIFEFSNSLNSSAATSGRTTSFELFNSGVALKFCKDAVSVDLEVWVGLCAFGKMCAKKRGHKGGDKV